MRAFFLARSADPIPERVLEEMQQRQACDEVGPRRRPAAEGKRVPVAVGTGVILKIVVRREPVC